MADRIEVIKYKLMVYLVGHGMKDLGSLVALTPEEAAEKFKGASQEILEALTKYVQATKKRIEAKGFFFPGVGSHEHTSKVGTVNGLRKYLKSQGKTLDGLGLTTSSRQRRPAINTAEDALDFLKGVKR
jgi:hypothetical protein